MLTRIIRQPNGFLNKVWRKTQRLPVPLRIDHLEILEPPLWPYRYQGLGISLCSLDTPIPAAASDDRLPKA